VVARRYELPLLLARKNQMNERRKKCTQSYIYHKQGREKKEGVEKQAVMVVYVLLSQHETNARFHVFFFVLIQPMVSSREEELMCCAEV